MTWPKLVLPNRRCDWCEVEFTPIRRNQLYCDAVCRIKKNDVKYNPAHAQTLRKYKLKYQYGITVEEYDAMLAKQGGVCNICQRTPSEGRNFHIDHDHDTGVVRGILCPKCNQQLGWLELYRDRIRMHTSAV